MNYLTLLRNAKDELEQAYYLAQNNTRNALVKSELICIEAQNKISKAIIEMRKDSPES